jgi:hypothetical protein
VCPAVGWSEAEACAQSAHTPLMLSCSRRCHGVSSGGAVCSSGGAHAGTGRPGERILTLGHVHDAGNASRPLAEIGSALNRKPQVTRRLVLPRTLLLPPGPPRAPLQLVSIDFSPFAEAAAMLYGGSLVAERYSGLRTFLDTRGAAAAPAGDAHARRGMPLGCLLAVPPAW